MEKEEEPPLHSKSKINLKNIFITGLVTVLPIGLTIFIFKFVIEIGGAVFAPIAKYIPLPKIATDILGFLLLLITILSIGILAKTFAGRVILSWGSKIVRKVPMIRVIFNASKELTDTFFLDKSAFRKVVALEYPRKGIYSIGFLTNTITWVEGLDKKGEKTIFYSIFVPTTPNPTSGYYLVLPKEEFIITDLTIEEGLRAIVSAGIVIPKKKLFIQEKKIFTIDKNKTKNRKENKLIEE